MLKTKWLYLGDLALVVVFVSQSAGCTRFGFGVDAGVFDDADDRPSASDGARFDGLATDAFQSDAFQPDTFQPDTFQPDTFQPDTGLEDSFLGDTVSSDANLAAIEFESLSPTLAAEGDGLITVTLTLSTALGVPVGIKVMASDTGTASGADYQFPAGDIVTITAGETSAHLSIQIVDDSTIEPIEFFDITLGTVTPGVAMVGARSSHRIIITDNDPETTMLVVSAATHNCVLNSAGQVKCWGGNASGELGLGDTENRGDEPGEMGAALPAVNLGSSVRVVDLSAGESGAHTCALLSSGDVKCWGYGRTWNEPGYMGYGHSRNLGDEATDMGDNLPTIQLGQGVKVKDLTSSSFNTCVITSDQRAKCWGVGFYGANGNGSSACVGASLLQMGDNLPYLQLGAGARVLKIAMGAFHRCALLDNLKLKCWGWNVVGQLGYEDTNTRGDDLSEMGDNLRYVDLGAGAQVVDVVASTGMYVERPEEHHSCALLSTGQVKCWGGGGYGRLGYGDTSRRGDTPGSMGDSLGTVDLGTGRTAKRIFASNGSTCAILDNNGLKCWGRGAAGQLGNNSQASIGDGSGEMGDDLEPVFLGLGRYARHVSGSFVLWGEGHRCALLDNNEVKCWGKNGLGELGAGNTEVLGDGLGEMQVLGAISL
ncbi:MAG: hypothetical protein JRH20_30735 [Deltaproteobacteria bacterium]|nr:hypothetical protein [Deltaproteobacteria bacterium]